MLMSLAYSLQQSFSNCGLWPQMGTHSLKFWKIWNKKILGSQKQIGFLCFVLQNFENPSNAKKLLKKISLVMSNLWWLLHM